MKKIDLTVPASWNEMTTRQMEQIIDLYDKNLQANAFQCLAFLKLINMKVLQRVVNEEKEFSIYLLRHKGILPWLKRESIPVRSWQIRSWANKFLGYLLKECDRMMSPYPTMKLKGVMFKGPGHCLADFSWHQYKWSQDYLQLFRKQQTHLQWLIDNNGSKTDIKKCVKQCKLYRNCFLSSVFTPEVYHTNDTTGKQEQTFTYQQGQTEKNYGYFNKVTDTQFKVIIVFWDGVMAYFQRTFPHLYKSGSGASKVNDDMLKNEAVNMVTLIDRLKCTSEKVYAENMMFVLETLERISMEAEEMKKMQAQMKK